VQVVDRLQNAVQELLQNGRSGENGPQFLTLILRITRWIYQIALSVTIPGINIVGRTRLYWLSQ